MTDWSDGELRSAIRAYLLMLAKQQAGETYSKAAIRRELLIGPLKKRNEPSIEYRMRNISAVLDDHQRSTLQGYVAAKNVGAPTKARIWSIIKEFDAAPPILATASPTTKSAKTPPMIYFNVGWMKHYKGAVADDETVGGHGYLANYSHGAEAFNFLPVKGVLQGYRPPGSREETNIDRLGASAGDKWIDGVTVVWLAKEPKTRQTLIVGWYRNARVYREAQDGGRIMNGESHNFSAETKIENARLLPVVARSFQVNSSRKAPGEGYGQKPTWYGAPTVNGRVWAYIRSVEGNIAATASKTPSKKPPKNLDTELRRKVERAAVDHATKYYKAIYGSACRVHSVEKDAVGWDLEIYHHAEPLLVEVKGLLNAKLCCELSPNEYEKMMMPQYRQRYVIYVVNNALAEAPASAIPSIFEHVGGSMWQTKDGRQLVITEKTGAVLSC